MGNEISRLGQDFSNTVINNAKIQQGNEDHKTKIDKNERDTFEKERIADELPCDLYANIRNCKKMPKSTFADSFGYDMEDEIFLYMCDFYQNKLDQVKLGEYFQNCCSSMRAYRMRQGQTSGDNTDHNCQIISQMYEVFAKQSVRAAGQTNCLEGMKINQSYGAMGQVDDWVYYNSDYYYKSNEVKLQLQDLTQTMANQWNVGSIDTEKIEQNSILTADGKFDFNSYWNFLFRNEVGRGSIEKENTVPPKGFVLFYKESIASNTKEVSDVQKGLLKMKLGTDLYTKEIPFTISGNGLQGQIFHLHAFMQDDLGMTEQTKQTIEFLNSFALFTKWYAIQSGIRFKFGDYVAATL